jgi:hypothetical protein
MSSVELKKYNSLLRERQSILDETKRWKCGLTISNQRLGLWSSSTYLDELLYIRQSIDKEITECEIMFRVKFYKKLENKLPKDTIHHIASFGNNIDHSASNLLN